MLNIFKNRHNPLWERGEREKKRVGIIHSENKDESVSSEKVFTRANLQIKVNGKASKCSELLCLKDAV